MRCKARNPRLIYAGVSRQTRRLEILRLAECFDSTPPYMTELQVWNDWFNSRSLLSNLQIYSHCYNAQTVLVLVISETDSLSAVNEAVSKGASRWMEINNLVHHFKKVKNRGDVTLVLFHILFLSLLNLKTREHIQEERVLLIFPSFCIILSGFQIELSKIFHFTPLWILFWQMPPHRRLPTDVTLPVTFLRILNAQLLPRNARSRVWHNLEVSVTWVICGSSF